MVPRIVHVQIADCMCRLHVQIDVMASWTGRHGGCSVASFLRQVIKISGQIYLLSNADWP